MQALTPFTGFTRYLLLGGLLCCGQLQADNDDPKGKQQHHDKRQASQQEARRDHFEHDRKQLVKQYFAEEQRHGRCPPGLAKKNNGCNPPGQVVRWQLGQSLQNNVTYYSLPADLSALLGQPQAGYHYGMVDSDILLLVDGTEMVLDAIANLGQ